MRMASVTRLNYRLLPITGAGKGCRNRAKERALIMVLVMSAYEAT